MLAEFEKSVAAGTLDAMSESLHKRYDAAATETRKSGIAQKIAAVAEVRRMLEEETF
jgi:hypothetical protein